MIKSGLVQQNYGYGTYPSDHTSGGSIFIRPSIPLEPRSGVPFKKHMPNSVIQGDKLTSNDILFPHLNLYDIFRPKPSYPMYNVEGVQVGADGKQIPPPVPIGQTGAQTGSQTGAQTDSQTEPYVLLTEGAAEQQGRSRNSSARSVVEQILRGMGVAAGAVGVILSGPLGTLLINLLTGPNSSQQQRAVEAMVHAAMPQPVAQIVTQGLRAVTDHSEMLRRIFQDAIVNPAARMTGTAAQATVNNILFAQGGILGPGYVQALTQAVAGVPQISWQNFGQMALEGAQNAAETAAGGPVVMTIPRLVMTYLEVIGAMGLNIVAPRQARQIAQRWARDGTLRNIARISYAGMGG